MNKRELLNDMVDEQISKEIDTLIADINEVDVPAADTDLFNDSSVKIISGDDLFEDIETGLFDELDVESSDEEFDGINDLMEELNDINEQENLEPEVEIIELTGAVLVDGLFPIINVDFEYGLEDENGNDFFKISEEVSEKSIIEKIQQQGGNTVEITQKNLIKEHGLFGEKVVYLNLPEHQKKTVFILVSYQKFGDLWLLQIDYDKYYDSKSLIQKMFLDYYKN